MNRHLVEQLGLRGVTGQFHGANETQITEVEANLGAQLPQDYKNFLRDFGATLFTEEVFFKPLEPSPWTADGKGSLDVFCGVSTDAGFDVSRANARLSGDIPSGTIAIGYDSGSNLILLSLRTNQILFFDKETGKTYLIASSFQDFLKSFRVG